MVKYNETGLNFNRCGTKYNPAPNWTPPQPRTWAEINKPARTASTRPTSPNTAVILGTLAALTDIFKGGDYTPRGFHLAPRKINGEYFRRTAHLRPYALGHTKLTKGITAPRHIASRQTVGDGLTNHQRVLLNQSK